MENLNIDTRRIIILITSIVLFTSCGTSSKQTKLENSKNVAISVAVKDFQNKESSKKSSVYLIQENRETNDLYSFQIFAKEKFDLHVGDTIGGNSNYFPSQFMELNENLYLWRNPKTKITKELIDKLRQRNLIDSTFYKIEKGLLSEENLPSGKISEPQKTPVYFVCKRNVTTFTKLKSGHVIDTLSYPILDCK